MKKIISVFFIFLVCTAILLTGCSQKTDEVDKKLVPSPSSAIEENKDGNIQDKKDRIAPEYSLKENIEEITIKEAWGDVAIIQKDFSVSEQKSTMALSISDEGDLLLVDSVYKTVNFVDSWNETLSISNIYNDKTETIKSVSSPTCITFGLINSDWVVWREDIYVGISPIKTEVYGYNRKTKVTKLYYKLSEEEDGKSLAHIPTPYLKGNEVLIDTLTVKEGGSANKVTSHKYNLITGKSEVIAEQFACPQWGDNGYIGLGEDKSNESYSKFLKLDNGVKTPLMEKGLYVFSYDSDGEAVLYNGQIFKTDTPSREALQLNLWLCENGEELLLKAATAQSGSGWPCLSKRIAMWNYDSKPYAYDRVLKKTVVLCEDPQGSTYYTSDKYLFWKSKGENDGENVFSILNIIEIDKLPKK